MATITDQEIVDQLKQGNTSVFKVLYNDFDRITRFIIQNSGNVEDAKDYFHEALIILYEKIKSGKFELRSKLSTFLYSVCRNLWLYFLRDNKPLIYNRLKQADDESKDLLNLTEDEFDYESKEERLTTIMEVIDKLTEPCYSILMMFYFQKLSFKIIAEKLDYKTEKVVKNQKYRCLQKIREQLPDDFLEQY